MFKKNRPPLAAGVTSLFLAALFALPAAAQAPSIPLDTLVANHGSVTAGDVTFSNFKKPVYIPRQVEQFLFEFNDIGVSATPNGDGTVSLQFIAIDANGVASPIVVGGTGPGEILRLVSYTATVTNPVRRLHSVSQTWGPLTALVPGSGSLPFNLLFHVEPVMFGLTGVPFFQGLRDDFAQGTAPYETFFYGGNPPSYDLENEFGVLKGHTGVPAGATLDAIVMTFSLVPAGTAVPPPLVPVNLSQSADPAIGGYFASAFMIEPKAGILQLTLNSYAQDGGAVISLTSDNPAALSVPSTVTIPQATFISAPILLGPANVDFPTPVTLTASFNGRTQTTVYTANPPIPLAISGFFAGTLLCGGSPCTLNTGMTVSMLMNRANVSSETIFLTSSNPAICPIPASIALPALTQPNLFPVLNLACKAVAVDTPITFTATLNGVTSSVTATYYRTTDNVLITRAELVTKNLSLKVDATNQVPGDVLTLYNNATGQLIGNMTMTGTQGIGGKYSFQGTISAPVATLLLKSALNGKTTFVVSQK